MPNLILFLLLNLFLSGCSTILGTTLAEGVESSVAAEMNIKLAAAYLKHGCFKEAKQKFLIAKKLDSNNPAIWYSMGYFHESIGELEQAKKEYKSAIALAPKNGAAHNNYGVFLCRMGKYEQSIKHFLLAVADPEYLDSGAAYENAGLCALKIPQKKLAIHYFKKACEQEPRLVHSGFYLAKLAFDDGNYIEAKKYLSTSVMLEDNSRQTLTLGVKVGECLHDKKFIQLNQNKLYLLLHN